VIEVGEELIELSADGLFVSVEKGLNGVELHVKVLSDLRGGHSAIGDEGEYTTSLALECGVRAISGDLEEVLFPLELESFIKSIVEDVLFRGFDFGLEVGMLLGLAMDLTQVREGIVFNNDAEPRAELSFAFVVVFELLHEDEVDILREVLKVCRPDPNVT